MNGDYKGLCRRHDWKEVLGRTRDEEAAELVTAHGTVTLINLDLKTR